MKIVKRFSSRDEWFSFANINGHLFSKEFTSNLVENIAQHGFIDPISKNRVQGFSVDINHSNLRESIKFNGWISRHRAAYLMMSLLTDIESRRDEINIYSPEAITGWASTMRSLFPNFVGSEFEPGPEVLAKIYPFGNQNLCEMTFNSYMFDIVVTQEIFEHIPNVEKALSEIFRVLAPGGWSINTHPFAFKSYSSLTKAFEKDGNIVTIGEPEYHGNPIGGSGSLVFQIPGWDLLDKAKAQGFSDVSMWFIVFPEFGILSDISGIFVSCFRK